MIPGLLSFMPILTKDMMAMNFPQTILQVSSSVGFYTMSLIDLLLRAENKGESLREKKECSNRKYFCLGLKLFKGILSFSFFLWSKMILHPDDILINTFSFDCFSNEKLLIIQWTKYFCCLFRKKNFSFLRKRLPY